MSPAPEPRMSAISVLSPTRLLASRPVSPIETPLMNSPALQPSSTPRWSRSASPSGWVSARRARSGGPGRGATSPAPSSRRARSAIAPAHQRGRRDQHQRQRPPALARVGAHLLAPADRRQPRERAVADVARRAQQVRGADRAAGDPVHRRRALADLGRHRGDAREHEPDAGQRGAERERALRGRPAPIIASATSTPEQQLRGRRPRSSAAATGAKRPTGAAPISSLRPFCSSARVWRPTMNMLISATNAAPKPPICHATSPPTVVRS